MTDGDESGDAHRGAVRRACIFPIMIIIVALIVLGVAIWGLVDRPGQGVIAVPGITKGVPDDGSGSGAATNAPPAGEPK